MKVLEQYHHQAIDNDIYILEYIHGQIIINDNYSGLLILDKNLKVTKKLAFPEHFSIYRVYTACDGKKLLLYNADDMRMLSISLNTQIIKEIHTKYTDIIFSSTYYWDTQLILTANPDKFYILESNKSNIVECSSSYIKELHSKFYNFWENTKKYNTLYNINSCDKTFIFEDEKKSEIVFFSEKNNQKHNIKKPQNIDYHDVIFNNGTFVFIAEKELLIINENLSIHLFPKANYYFRKARFALEHDQIIIFVLSSNGKDCKINTITKYQISHAH